MSQTTEPSQVVADVGSEVTSLSHPIQVIASFLRVVLFRREILIVALVASLLLGGLYYATATRIYRANALLLVLQTGEQDMAASMPGERIAKDLMPTYTNLATSEEVLIEAANLIPPEHRIDFAGVPRSNWPGVLRDGLSVSATRGTNILSIAYSSKDPEAAGAVVEAVLEAYLTFMTDLYRSTASEVADLLDRKLANIDQELEAKDAERLQIQRQAEDLAIKDGERGSNAVVARAIELNTAWTEAQKRRLEAQSQLVGLQHAIQRGEDLEQFALAMVESVGTEFIRGMVGVGTQDAYIIAHMTQVLLRDRAELHAARQTYGPQHRTVRDLEERVRVTEQYLNNRRQMQVATLQQASNEHLAPLLEQIAQQKYQSALLHEQNLRASFDAASQEAINLNESATRLSAVERELDHLFALRQAVVERLKEIDLDQGSGLLKTKIIKNPQAPDGPSSPRLVKTFALAVLLGLVIGLGAIYILDLLDDRFRSPEEMQTQLGVPVLAMIRKLEPLDRVGPGGIHVHVAPTGVEAESFRTLRTALAFADGGASRLVVTSTEPGDGKTTISVNLGTAIAQSGKRTLLIDADMRRPGLTPLVNLRGQRGLATILRDAAPVVESACQNVVSSFLPNLDIIPSGPRPVNPMELLASERFSDLLAWAETVYDQIIVDSPPVLAVSDSAVIGRLVDGVVLTVRPEKNRRRLVIRAIDSFPPLGVNILGIVINHVDAEKSQSYYGYSYGYGYGYGYAYGDDLEAPHDRTIDADEPRRPRRVASDAA